MSEKEWASFGFPPLRLTTADLQSLLDTAGPDAQLSVDGETPVEADALVPDAQRWVASAVIRTPELRLEFADDHASLNFDNRNAVIAEELAQALCPEHKSGGSIIASVVLGSALFVPLFLMGVRTDVASLVAMGAMLVSIIALSFRRQTTQPTGAPVEGNPGEWCTTFPVARLGFDDLAMHLQTLGDGATLEFASDEQGPMVRMRSSGIRVTLRESTGEVRYEDASARMETLYNTVQQHRRPLRWFTHDDLAILVGMLFPVAAIFLAPAEMRKNATLLAIVPWLGYLLWVLRNQSRKWSVIVRS